MTATVGDEQYEREKLRRVTHQQVQDAMAEYRARGGTIVTLKPEVGDTMGNLVQPRNGG